MGRRINVVLSDATVRTLDRLSRPGQPSRLIEHAVQHYLMTNSPRALGKRLKAAALRDRDLDLEIAGAWAAVHQEQWQRFEVPTKRRRGTGRNKAKSN
ncbi:MAG: hypothetical protein LAP40_17075 [Acidobacteriia bacterium]|nr:hypothetical protein [Terriglobia bacterium]